MSCGILKVYAESLGVDFRFDPLINNTIAGASFPQAYRLSPEDVVRYDLEDTRRRDEMLQFWQRFREACLDFSHLYACGAGLNSFHIDPYGKLYPWNDVTCPGI